jgi:putative glutamine amidotransferase
VNKERDKFEIELIHRALKNKTPVLGICRGLQMFNVALGGTLIMDLEKSGFKNHRMQNGQQKSHKIEVHSNSVLSKVIGSGSKIVNTYHHQAIDDIGKDLKVSARSTDGVIEAAEWNNPVGKSPLLLVQWHPERMKTSLTSKKIINKFIKKIK